MKKENRRSPTVKRIASRIQAGKQNSATVESIMLLHILEQMMKADRRNYPWPGSRPARGGAIKHRKWKRQRAAGLHAGHKLRRAA